MCVKGKNKNIEDIQEVGTKVKLVLDSDVVIPVNTTFEGIGIDIMLGCINSCEPQMLRRRVSRYTMASNLRKGA
ncbi:hypothetical protein AZF06_21315 [Priestia endophytica]|nr:hypothetical protein AZF06_21315 [Priestia endophytica]